MLKCLFIMHDWDGGAERVSLNVAKSLNRKLIDSTVCCLHHLPQLTAIMPQDQKFSMPEEPGLFSKIRHFFKIRKMAKESDVVIGTLQLQSVFAAAIFSPKKPIAWLRNDLQGKFTGKTKISVKIYKLLLGWALNRSRLTVCVSEGVRQSCSAIWPALLPRLMVLRNPTDIETIRNEAKKPLPESLNQCFQKPVVLGVGRLEEQKNFPLLIEACSILRQRGHIFNLCLVGRGTQKEKLEMLANDLNMSDSIYFTGWQPNPYAIMARARVLALSSNHEGNPNVLIEALCLGTPIVATNCPSGPDEILCDGEYGRLVPMNDAVALADALESILDNPPDAAQIEAGKKRAEDFGLERGIAAWQDLIYEIKMEENSAKFF